MDDSDHTHPHYENEMKKSILLPSWSEPEVTDLNVLMRDVMDFSREWIDKQMNKLIGMGVVFTFEKMKRAKSSLEND